MKVLIAEDDAVSRLVLTKAVEKLGHECLAAPDGEEAWSIYQRSPDVEVIISDWMMPGMDGLELCEKVRSFREDRGVYPFFIFLTALGDREHLLEAMQAGADDYLAKPLDREELRVRLIAASRVTSLHRQLAEQKRELERLNEELFNQARIDPLTLLGNRLRLMEDMRAFDDRARRYGHSFCAVLCDVDHFKRYNDHYGHLAGDVALQKVADAIRKSFRAGDGAYRYGGEEFLVLLPEQSLEGAESAAERLRRSIEDLNIPHEAAPENGGRLTMSVGLSRMNPDGRRDLEQLIKEADEALYRAKERGRNRVVVYDESAG